MRFKKQICWIFVNFWLKAVMGNYLSTCPFWPKSNKFHNNVMIWKCFPHYWPIVWVIHQPLVVSPPQGVHNVKLWCFLCKTQEQVVEQMTKLWANCETMMLMWHHCNVLAFQSSEVGVTKALFANFSISKIFDLAKVPVRFPESHSYLTGVTAAELRLITNVHFDNNGKCGKQWNRENWLSNPHPWSIV